MRLNDSGGGKKKSNPLGIKPTHKASSKKKSGSSWLTRTAKKVYKAIGGKHGYGSEKAGKKKSSKSSTKGKSIMETTTAKKKAEKEMAKGSSKTVKPNTKISHTSTKSKTSSKPKTSTTHKSTSSTHKTTSSAKKDAVKRASGTSSKPKTSTAKKAPSKTTAKKPSTKTASKKTPSKASQIKSGFKKGSDSYYNGQKALLDSGKTTDLAGVSKAYNESMESENKNIRDNNNAYDDRVGVINDDAYRQAQLTQIGAYDMGIQNSQQLLGLQAGDSYRRDTQEIGRAHV